MLLFFFSEKDLALGLLQTAVAQLIPQPLPSIPAEKLWNHLQDLQEPPQETLQATYRWAPHPPLLGPGLIGRQFLQTPDSVPNVATL